MSSSSSGGSRPNQWAPEMAGPAPSVPSLFPWTSRSTLEMVAMLAVAAGAFIAKAMASSDLAKAAGAGAAGALFVAWVAWLASDIIVFRRALPTIPKSVGAFRPTARLPFRHSMAPIYLAALLVAVAFGEAGAPFALALVLLFWIMSQITSTAIAYMTLPSDSVEATLQRDAAAISFLVVAAVCSSLIFGWSFIARVDIVHSPKRFLLADVVSLTPVVFVYATYGVTYFILKQRRG